MSPKSGWATFTAILLSLVLATGALYGLYYRQNYHEAVKHARSDFAILAQSKSEYAEAWINERMSDANYVLGTQYSSRRVAEFVIAASHADSSSSYVPWLNPAFGNSSYTSVLLVDTAGNTLYSRPVHVSLSLSELESFHKAVSRLDSVVVVGHSSSPDGQGSADIIVPFFDPTNGQRKVIRAAIFRVEFSGYLNRLLSGALTSTNTRDTYIALSTPDSLCLVPCDARDVSTLPPLDTLQSLLAAAEAHGEHSVSLLDGRDGSKVVIAIIRGEKFPWPLIIMQDLDAAIQVQRLQARFVGALLLLFLGLSGAGLFILTRRERTRLVQAQTQHDQEKQVVEAELKDKDAVYKLLFESSLDAILIATPKGEINALNPAACRMFGGTEEEVRRLGRNGVIDPNEPLNIEALNTRTRTGQFRGEMVMLRVDGSRFHADVSSSVFLDSRGSKYLHVIIRDISDAHANRIELERRERHLLESQYVGRVGSWEANVLTGESYWSQNLYTVLGRDPVLGPHNMEESLRLIVDPEHAKSVEDLIHLFKDREIVEGQRTLVSSAGSTVVHRYTIRPFRVHGQSITRLFGSVVDVTELAKAEQEIRSLVAHVVSAREEERTKIARDIHDDLGQMLTAVKIDLSSFVRHLSQPETSRITKVNSMLDLVDGMIQTVKRLTSELRPGILDDLGLEAAMEWHLKQFTDRTGIVHEYSFEFPQELLSRDLSTTLFRVTQEALTNIARHAQATKVLVSVNELPGEVVLIISDDGIGIPKDAVNDSTSFGLLSIRERAAYFGGSANFKSEGSRGTMIKVRIPVRKEAIHD